MCVIYVLLHKWDIYTLSCILSFFTDQCTLKIALYQQTRSRFICLYWKLTNLSPWEPAEFLEVAVPSFSRLPKKTREGKKVFSPFPTVWCYSFHFADRKNEARQVTRLGRSLLFLTLKSFLRASMTTFSFKRASFYEHFPFLYFTYDIKKAHSN